MPDHASCLRTHRCARLWFFTSVLSIAPIISFAVQPANAQTRVATPGDSPADAGPLAHLSPKFKRRDVAKAMKLVADWQLNRLPPQPQYDWTWAALYTGFMAVPDQIAGDKYKNAVMKIGEELNWQPGPRVMHADDQAVGQSYLELYMIHKDPKMMEPMRARLDAEIATPESDYAKKPLWWWCDALYMAPPVFADMAAATGDQKYLTFMDRQWGITTNLLYDPSVHLYSRDAGFLNRHEKNGEKLF